jgi:hypothetical protein
MLAWTVTVLPGAAVAGVAVRLAAGAGGGAVVLLTLTARGLLVVVFPAASRATAVRLCEPLATVVVFQVTE